MKLMPHRLFGLGMVLTAILLPLEIIPNRYISLLSLFTTLLLIPFPLQRIFSGRQKPSLNRPWLWAAFAIPAAWILVTLISHLPGDGHAIRSLLVLLLRAWLIAQFAEKNHLLLFLKTSIGMGVLVLLFGFFQFFADLAGLSKNITLLKQTYSSSMGTYSFPRVHSLEGEPLLMVAYLIIPMAILLTSIRRDWNYNYFSVLFILLAAVLMISSASRGGLIAVTVMLVLFFSRNLSIKNLGLIASGIALVTAVSLGGLAVTKGDGAVKQFLSHITEHKDLSFQSRVGVWNKFPAIFSGNEAFGVGVGNSHKKLISEKDYANQSDIVFNNSYLTLLIEVGVMGALTFLPLAFFLLQVCVAGYISRFRGPVSAFALIIIAYATQLTTYEGFLSLRVWAVIGLSLAAYRLYSQPNLGLQHA